MRLGKTGRSWPRKIGKKIDGKVKERNPKKMLNCVSHGNRALFSAWRRWGGGLCWGGEHNAPGGVNCLIGAGLNCFKLLSADGAREQGVLVRGVRAVW